MAIIPDIPRPPRASQQAARKPASPRKTPNPGYGGFNGPGGLAMAAGVNPQQHAAQQAARQGNPVAQQFVANNGGGGGGGGYGGGGGLAPMSAPTIPTLEDYLSKDEILTATLAALDRAMKDYTAQDTADREKYERDYTQGLNNLGWRDLDPGDGVSMGWDWNDILSSSGRAYQNQLNDFASRGALQSSGYADALAALNRSLGDQRTAMETGRRDFLSEKDRSKTEFINQDTLARQQARAEATARRRAEYGV